MSPRNLIPTLLALLATTPSAQAKSWFSLPSETRQLVIVTTTDTKATTGELRRFEQTRGAWKRVGPVIPVSVGKGGLGWGIGLHPNRNDGPLKREGDGRSPMGIFPLGTVTGYAPAPPPGTKMPYKEATPALRCVDDPESDRYNQLTEAPSNGPPPWRSDERMRRDDALYEWTIFVEHNVKPRRAGAGSCIFLHVWRAPGDPTVGCTAMARADLESLVKWLDPAARPLLVQLAGRKWEPGRDSGLPLTLD